MKTFMDEDFLLSTETAKKLYHKYASVMPIVDYHCHINPQEIYEDKKFKNITELWLKADHYKWRLMRSNGVEEYYITGQASDREKFQKWAETLERAIGNPLYHWSHLELQRYFGYEGYLNGETAQEVWDLCNKHMATNSMTARNIIRSSNVEVICTTDDPVDSLKWHKLLAEDRSCDVKVLPTWRPDRAIHLEKPDFCEYLLVLEKASGVEIRSFETLLRALKVRMDFFEAIGCRISDHGLEYVMYAPAENSKINGIFEKRMSGIKLTELETIQFKTAILLELGKMYQEKNWAMQLHYGVKRDNNQYLFEILGPDAGVDCINNAIPSAQLADFLNALAKKNQLPKTIIYSLNPNDNAAIGTVMGCFQGDHIRGKIQHGSAWWFNDHKAGMTEQMVSVANLGLLGNFIGMLTDSRSFLSYTRHEYFRRILCELLGTWVENGEYPNDDKALEKIIKDISYYNAVRYFELD